MHRDPLEVLDRRNEKILDKPHSTKKIHFPHRHHTNHYCCPIVEILWKKKHDLLKAVVS
jgi:hypothetical protein